jgi:Fusaric acid resistance protein-like
MRAEADARRDASLLDFWLRTTPRAKFSTDESPGLALVLTLIEGLGLRQIAARILHELAPGVRAAEAVGFALDRRVDGAIRLHILVIGETPGTHVAELAPTLVPVDYAYLAGAVLLSIVSRVLDHLINGPLQSASPWFSAASFDRSGWVRFALAYALASTVGLWIGIQSGSIRAVWISAITLVLMVPNVRTTYNRVFEGVLGTALAVGTVWIIIRFWHSPGLLSAIILLTAFFLPSQLTRFWAFIGMIAVIVLLAWDLANGDPALEPALLLERLVDVFVAASLVLIVTAILFPRTTWSILKRAESQS